MKKLSRLIFVLLLTNTVLMGCSTAKVVSLKTPAQGNAVIYLYRPEIDKPGLPPLWLQYPEVFIDGESQGVLKLNHYKVIELPAGSHTLLFTGLSENAKWDQKDIEKILSLKPGERYFLKLNVLFDLSKMSLGSDWTGRYLISVYPVKESEAIYQLRELKEDKNPKR